MANSLAKPLRTKALKFIYLQGVVALVSALVVWLGWGVLAGKSALIGGFVALLPNFVYTLYAFRFAGARQVQQVYSSIKRGAGLKYLLTILLFALVLKSSTVVLLPFFSVYVLVMIVSWFAPIFFH
ncbi:MAG: ATP synthase subunit I [Pseudomonadota bacterium]|uniref:ATP synthase subunit I n=1 Tax=Pseudoalteromonas TaxID=53246 RepID=UPI00026CD895|nr:MULTISPECIES: ATP synthase subunit I [Pseudoalteromonas]ATD00099.1 ATP synthase protein I [Pseudoalteromonas spongiae UST010723-006]KPV96176.1 F0F1 ATP synthase subunit I [Pseudoalteromonas sp. P1-9]MEC8328244.1 ATP synthase subunit I [Pseudomonadota bacterium]TMO85491.1 F0F1 ATP synthase assembly protein I [Pseudoalteromonas spongiae]